MMLPLILLNTAPLAEAADPSFWDIVVRSNFLNFCIAFAALAFLFKKFNLLGLLDKRQESIAKELKDAEAKRDQALADLQAIETRSAQLKTEMDTLLKEAELTAGQVAQSIVDNAEAEAQKILDNAQKRVVQEQKTAARDLESRLMAEAIHAAQELLENTLSKDDKKQSVVMFIDQLPALAEKV